jgi:hypothetical protein
LSNYWPALHSLGQKLAGRTPEKLVFKQLQALPQDVGWLRRVHRSQNSVAHYLGTVQCLAAPIGAVKLKHPPDQVIVDVWQKNPAIFKTDPRHLIPGPYT